MKIYEVFEFLHWTSEKLSITCVENCFKWCQRWWLQWYFLTGPNFFTSFWNTGLFLSSPTHLFSITTPPLASGHWDYLQVKAGQPKLDKITGLSQIFRKILRKVQFCALFFWVWEQAGVSRRLYWQLVDRQRLWRFFHYTSEFCSLNARASPSTASSSLWYTAPSSFSFSRVSLYPSGSLPFLIWRFACRLMSQKHMHIFTEHPLVVSAPFFFSCQPKWFVASYSTFTTTRPTEPRP